MENRLSQLRAEHHLYQEHLAAKVHCTQQLISSYETGKLKRIPVDFEEKICNYFNCSLDYLRCRTNIRNDERYSKTLRKIELIIEEFYADSENRKSQQDLSDEELANFQELLSRFKDILQKFPKM